MVVIIKSKQIIIISLITISLLISGVLAIYILGYQKVNTNPSTVPWGYPDYDEHELTYFEAGQKFNAKASFGGMRIIENANKNGDEHFIISGGSNAFGEKIPDNLTLPILFGKAPAFKNITPHIIAYPGWGAHNVLSYLENNDLKKHVKAPKGIFVYQLINDHIDRVCGSDAYLEWSNGTSPKYVIENGELVHKGKFNESLYFKLFTFKKGLRLISPIKIAPIKKSYLKKSKDLEKVYPQRCIDILIGILNRIEYLYKKQFPQGKFFVITYPVYKNPHDEIDIEVMKKLNFSLNRERITFLNPVTFYQDQLKKYNIDKFRLMTSDRHVNGSYYELMLPFYNFLRTIEK